MNFVYRALGLEITAPFPCPGLAPAVGPATGRGITLALGAVPARLDDPVRARPLLQIDAAGTALHAVPGVARYLIEARSHVTIACEPGVTLDRAFTFLKGTPLALLCYQWGLLPLNAVCVALEGRALVLAAGPGCGKTTLALALAAHGAALMSDSLIALDAQADTSPLIWPAFPEARAWRDSFEALGRPVPGEPGPGGRYTLPAATWFEPAPRPVLAIVVLHPARGGIAARVIRRHGALAFEAVMNLQSLADATRGLALGGHHPAQAIARLAQTAPVFEAWYPCELGQAAVVPAWLFAAMGLPLPPLADSGSVAACA